MQTVFEVFHYMIDDDPYGTDYEMSLGVSATLKEASDFIKEAFKPRDNHPCAYLVDVPGEQRGVIIRELKLGVFGWNSSEGSDNEVAVYNWRGERLEKKQVPFYRL